VRELWIGADHLGEQRPGAAVRARLDHGDTTPGQPWINGQYAHTAAFRSYNCSAAYRARAGGISPTRPCPARQVQVAGSVKGLPAMTG